MNPITQLMLVVAFAAGIFAALGGASLYDRLIDDPAVAREAREEGAKAERARWEEARKRAEILKMQRLAEAQAKISAADQTLQDLKAQDRRRAEAIQRALSERQDDEQINGRTGCDLSQCFLPDRVWQELQ